MNYHRVMSERKYADAVEAAYIRGHNDTVESRFNPNTAAVAAEIVEEFKKVTMKTDLKPILAALLASGGEIRIKSKHNESTFCIESHTIESYEELSFNPTPYEGICTGETRKSKEARLVRDAIIALEKRDSL